MHTRVNRRVGTPGVSCHQRDFPRVVLGNGCVTRSIERYLLRGDLSQLLLAGEYFADEIDLSAAVEVRVRFDGFSPLNLDLCMETRAYTNF